MAEYKDPDAFFDSRIGPALQALGGTRLFNGGKAPDGRPEGVTLEQTIWWTDYRTKIIEGKVDTANGHLGKLGDIVVYSQKGEDGKDVGVTLGQALFWTDYRTKVLEGKIDALTAKLDALVAKLGVDADA